MTDLARTAPPPEARAILAAIGLDPQDPQAAATVLLCHRYGLDPVLGHVLLVGGRVYVTRDGLLAAAHASGDLDGIELVNPAQLVDGEWKARVAVYRRGWSRPVTWTGVCGQGEHRNPAAMAVTRAERGALRRAFPLGIPDDDDTPANVTVEVAR